MEYLRKESMPIITKQIKMRLSKRAVTVLMTDMLVTGAVPMKTIKDGGAVSAWPEIAQERLWAFTIYGGTEDLV